MKRTFDYFYLFYMQNIKKFFSLTNNEIVCGENPKKNMCLENFNFVAEN